MKTNSILINEVHMISFVFKKPTLKYGQLSTQQKNIQRRSTYPIIAFLLSWGLRRS